MSSWTIRQQLAAKLCEATGVKVLGYVPAVPQAGIAFVRSQSAAIEQGDGQCDRELALAVEYLVSLSDGEHAQKQMCDLLDSVWALAHGGIHLDAGIITPLSSPAEFLSETPQGGLFLTGRVDFSRLTIGA